jgi:hypothetical protein
MPRCFVHRTIGVDAESVWPQRLRIQETKRDAFGMTLKIARMLCQASDEETIHDLAIHD